MTDADTRALAPKVVVLRRPRLAFHDAAGPHEVVVDEPRSLGSAEGASVRVDDPAVSRLHAELEPKDDGLWVRDAGSKNGTWVDGVRIERARVAEGGRITVGGTTIHVRYTEEREAASGELPTFGFSGASPSIQRLRARLADLAPRNVTALVLGETGAGKDLAIRALHEGSPRAGQPLVVVDCALPEALVMGELLGDAARESAIERAAGGTLVLDEVGDLPLPAQAALLKLLDARRPPRLGPGPALDVRFVATTQRDLLALAAAGSFREDLYFRLAGAPARVPPLRDRLGDLPALLAELAPALPASVDRAALLAKLAKRGWPGNVRELARLLDRLGATGEIESRATPPPAGGGPVVDLDRPLKEQREAWLTRLEVEYLKGLLARHGGNVTRVAEAAGIDRTYVHRLVKKHGL